MEGYEGVAALVRGGPLELPRYARGTLLKPALVVREVAGGCGRGWLDGEIDGEVR